MEDAGDLDPYNKSKYEDVSRAPEYPARQSNHRSRPSSQYYPQQEESSAARRYSPMKLSATPSNAGSQYASYTSSAQSTASRTSPTRPPLYSSHSNSYYSSPRTFNNMQDSLRYTFVTRDTASLVNVTCANITSTRSNEQSCPSTTSSTSQHKPRPGLLPSSFSYATAQRCLRSRSNALCDCSPAATTSAKDPGPSLHKMRECLRATTADQCSTCISAREPRGRLHQCKIATE